MLAVVNSADVAAASVNCRYITILTPEDPASAALGELGGEKEEDDSIDLRTLRAIRVLRPLKLVSGVPSEYVYM